jgi:glucosamine kinase
MIDYLLGVDGGGSGTRAIIATRDGAVLGHGTAGPSALGQGVPVAIQHVLTAIASACDDAGITGPARAACALSAGLSGTTNLQWKAAFMAGMQGWGHLVVESDAFIMLLGAHGGAPGVLVAAGTGSVGEALRPNGERQQVGGWGFPVGDEGSGAWIGLNAMRHAQCAADGRDQAGPLASAIFERCGADRVALQAWCANAGQFAYAQLAPLVFDTAPQDSAADHLLQQAARSLEAISAAVDPDQDWPLAVCGSIGVKLQNRFSDRTQRRIVQPAKSPAEGALLLLRSLPLE